MKNDKRHINFGSIPYFDGFYRDIRNTDKEIISSFLGLGEGEGYKWFLTEKIHGTNAAVCYNNKTGIYIQSKNKILTEKEDNAGCYAWCMERHHDWLTYIEKLAKYYDVDLDTNIISVFFEFAGKNIQSKSCVSGFDKVAAVFPFAEVNPLDPNYEDEDEDEDEDENERYIATVLYDKGAEAFDYVFNDRCDILSVNCATNENRTEINHYQMLLYNAGGVDLRDPEKLYGDLKNILEDVEQCSGFGRFRGNRWGVGEGLVLYVFPNISWERLDVPVNKMFIMKMKGNKHCLTDNLLLDKKQKEYQRLYDFAGECCEVERLENMFRKMKIKLKDSPVPEPGIDDFDDYFMLLWEDIIKEMSPTAEKKNINKKDMNKVRKNVEEISFKWYKHYLILLVYQLGLNQELIDN